ncbi:lysozyme [Diaphorobacter sp. HDW4B]|uniref:lysozyme n=1 Tax=Diaphorobacter sp. HDW4B TaxID=2714925 RepID=UPI00140C2421|nr:lysozyme [Diaphorobacter sp. HDW4B]QIL73272.1 lysozyme [Diaphorobacter sp. HDW4B]
MNDRAKLITKIGATAVALVIPVVTYYEGKVNRTYVDPVGVLTSCSGHTGPELKPGQTFTDEQCLAQLEADLTKHSIALDCVRVPVTDGQKAAFLSFAFNVGTGAFCGSTLVRKANTGDMPGACAELSKWVYAGGKQLPGLVKRRAAERAMCERDL